MPYLYILRCVDESYYTGSTWVLETRVWQHQNGFGGKYTAQRRPVELVYCEYCDRIVDAYAREQPVKGWSRRKKEALMAGDTNLLHEWARCQNASRREETPDPGLVI